MLPAALKHLAPLLAEAGSFAGGQQCARYAVPAVAGGKGAWGGKRVNVPMSEPLPGVDVPKYSAPAAPKVEVGQIEGVKAAAAATGGPNAAVELFVGGGSAAETPDTAGAAKLLEYMAFSATANRSTFRLTRELEKYGARAAARAGREGIAYRVEATAAEAAEATEMLLDAALNARLNEWEVRDMLPQLQADMEVAYAQPTLLARELLHRAAFSGGLAQPLLPDPDTVASLSRDALLEYVAAQFKPSNMALAASGTPMSALAGVAAPLLGDVAQRGGAAGGAPAAPASKYTGGVLTALAPGSAPVVALAYQAPGGLGDAKATALAAVIEALLDETREALPYMRKEAAGLPGGVLPFAHVYSSTGIVGLLAAPEPGRGAAAAAVAALAGRFEALAKGVPDATLAAAKRVVMGGYAAAAATKAGAAGALARQLLTPGGAADAGRYAAAVAALSGADVSAAVSAMLKGQPTLVAAGPLSELPKYDAAAKSFA